MLSDQPVKLNTLHSPLFTQYGVSMHIARLDLLHPIVSGNKIFKLHYFIKEALKSSPKKIVTFGGAYSNHLVATAYYCQSLGIQCIGIVRGEKPAILSHTLMHCLDYGMELEYISRNDYTRTETNHSVFKEKYKDCIIVPEGGYSHWGAMGAAKIMDNEALHSATHICMAVGTATTLAGIVLNAKPTQEVIGIPVIKNMNDLPDRLSFLTNDSTKKIPSFFNDYHFGGYSKKTNELIEFMNAFYTEFDIPTDFVYTAKMCYGVLDKISEGYFPKGSKICCLHTGGLQGNASLSKGTLVF